ncbi:MAG: hypothetical protein NVSMB8_09720 [Candidatus Limnocylindrales bacterium]
MSGELVAAVVLGSFVLYIAVAQLARSRGIRARGRTTERAIGFAQSSPIFVFIPYLIVLLRPGPELPLGDAVRWAGLVLAVAGVAFALWAMRTLGRHFDVELEVHEGHEVIERGPYALVRHPIYTGLALHFIGACLATGNLLLIAGTLGASFPAFYLRAVAEERLLRGRLGPAYDAYARRVAMLVPFFKGPHLG